MSWMSKLCEAYDCCIDADQTGEPNPLLPVGFIRKEIKYHIVLTAEGNFASAEEWAAKTYRAIPSTPQADSRTGSNGPAFPLAEQMKYLVCGDTPTPRYKGYMEQLNAWCTRDDAPEQLRVLKSYMERNTLLEDMTERALIKVKYTAENEDGADAKAMVTFSVQSTDGLGDELCERRDVRDSWSAYIAENASQERQLCYVEGKWLPLIDKHPKVQGNAKLISSKDAAFPFQYKGRFVEDGSSVAISYAASARAHSALDFLVNRQGLRRFGMTMVAWNTNGDEMYPPVSDWSDWGEDAPEKQKPDTFKAYSELLEKAADGYRQKLEQYDRLKRANEIVILCMEAATDGRMSITYYQEIEGSEYVNRLKRWYESCCWTLYSPQEKVYCVTTPTWRQIAEAVMGASAARTAEQDLKCGKAATKQLRELRQRLLECITGGGALPRDLVESAFNRAVKPLSFTAGRENKWAEADWRSALATTCALIRKLQLQEPKRGEPAEPQLDVCCTERSYLWGRLLAVADILEMRAMEKKSDYQTNAVRLMQRMAVRPADTWRQLHMKLLPYIKRLGARTDGTENAAAEYLELFGQIEQSFAREERISEAPLSYRFLQGYYSQRQALYGNKAVTRRAEMYALPHTRSELYGCLLAVADIAELEATGWEHCGATNALRLIPTFDHSPVGGWARIHDKLIPYLEKLGVDAERYQQLLRQIERGFQTEERLSTEPPDGSYLHGYYCMRQALIEGRFEPVKAKVNLPNLENVNSRDAAYGSMLGIENRLERWALDMEKDDADNRPSNAMRLMTRTAQTPTREWTYLRGRLEPYRKKLAFLANPYSKKLDSLEELIHAQGWDTDEPLDGSYLHHFYLI